VRGGKKGGVREATQKREKKGVSNSNWEHRSSQAENNPGLGKKEKKFDREGTSLSGTHGRHKMAIRVIQEKDF